MVLEMTVMTYVDLETADMSIAEETGQLHLNHFPVGLRQQLKIKALETGVTFRDLIVDVLRGYCNGPGEIAGDKRAAGVRGMRKGVPDGARSGGAGSKRDAEAGGAHGGAPAGAGAVDGGIRKDQGGDAKKAEGDEW